MKYLLLPLIAALALPAQVSANNLSLPNCNFLIRVNCIEEETDNNGKYVGQFLNNKRHGQGTFYWADGDSWTGEFLNGQRTNNGSWN